MVGFVAAVDGFVACLSFAEPEGAAALVCASDDAETTGRAVVSTVAVSTELGVTVGSTDLVGVVAPVAAELGEPCVSADGEPTVFIA